MPKASKGTTTVGFTNRRNQTVIRMIDVKGADRSQRVYMLRCNECEVEYGVNGTDIHARRCPSCGGGKPGFVTESV